MKLTLDSEARTLIVERDGETQVLDLYSRAAFEELSRQWVRVGWDQKYQYTFTWQGRPMIQLPEDVLRMQEVIHRLRPAVIVETGVAHGGSLVFYATLCKAMAHGHVIGVDIEIRPHNRASIESHPLSPLITLIEGSSTAPETIAQVRSAVSAKIQPGDTILVILDSNHSRQHVLDELEAYAGLVTVGSYIVATDGIMYDLADVPRGMADWPTDNPRQAAREFAAAHPEFVIEQPPWEFNESALADNITHWPDAWLKRLSS